MMTPLSVDDNNHAAPHANPRCRVGESLKFLPPAGHEGARALGRVGEDGDALIAAWPVSSWRYFSAKEPEPPTKRLATSDPQRLGPSR